MDVAELSQAFPYNGNDDAAARVAETGGARRVGEALEGGGIRNWPAESLRQSLCSGTGCQTEGGK